MKSNNENSVLFSIGSVLQLQQHKERELQDEAQRQKDDHDRAEAARLDQARRAAAAAQRLRQVEAAETARHEWERQVTDKETAIRARIEADTERQLELLRAEYREARPVVVPGRHRLSFAVASVMALAVVALGAYGVNAMTSDNLPPLKTSATANAATPGDEPVAATPGDEPVAPTPRVLAPTSRVLAPAPMTTIRVVEPTPVKIQGPAPRPIAKPYRTPTRPRCKWITVTKRVQNPLWNHPLNFEGRYKTIKKRVKKCRN